MLHFGRKRPEYQIDLIISVYVDKQRSWINSCIISENVHTTRVLSDRLTHLADSNFIVRMLFYEAYWKHSVYLFVICATFVITSLLQLRFVS